MENSCGRRTRSGRLPRLRRAAHRTFRRGTCCSPCPRERCSLAGSTPLGDAVPHCLRQRLPCWAYQKGRGGRLGKNSFLASLKDPRARMANRHGSTPKPAMPCLLFRHQVSSNKSSWHLLAGWDSLIRQYMFFLPKVLPADFASAGFFRLGGTGLPPAPLTCLVGQIWGLSGDVCAVAVVWVEMARR